ncbi:MAG: hypothetical protein KGD67_12870, partial [Candidatus Lokiarchaeota archaeon]|nr:hypothetical protein [Candidatus Lokiarchaeota archaeon]
MESNINVNNVKIYLNAQYILLLIYIIPIFIKLECLDISHNKIKIIENLGHLFVLKEIKLEYNLIINLNGLENLK